MANYRHPNFILAIISVLLAAIAIGFYTARMNEIADVLLLITVGLGAIHWIWSIIDVAKTDTLLGSQKTFWLLIVIIVPIGGIIYYMLHSKRNTIVD